MRPILIGLARHYTSLKISMIVHSVNLSDIDLNPFAVGMFVTLVIGYFLFNKRLSSVIMSQFGTLYKSDRWRVIITYGKATECDLTFLRG